MRTGEQLVVDADPRALAGLVNGAAIRDWEIVRWVGRMGAVTVDQLRARFELGRTVVYRRVAACVEDGLLERVSPLRAQPALIRATRRGLRYVGLPLPVAAIRPELVRHWLVCGSVGLALAREFGPDALRSEREVRIAERWCDRPFASARLGENPDGSDRLHLPDFAVACEDVTIAIEVELTSKAPRRLEAIVKAWRRARWVNEVRYYVADGATRRGVERAVTRMQAADRVEIRSIGQPRAAIA